MESKNDRPTELLDQLVCSDDDSPLQKKFAIPQKTLRARVAEKWALLKLSREVIDEVLQYLPFEDLATLRLVSYTTKLYVDSCPPWYNFTTSAPIALGVLRERGQLHLNTSGTLLRSLRQKTCSQCTDFGQFLFTLTGERVCKACLMINPRFTVISKKLAEAWYGPKSTKNLPYISRLRSNIECVQESEVQKAALREYGSIEKSRTAAYGRRRREWFKGPVNERAPRRHDFIADIDGADHSLSFLATYLVVSFPFRANLNKPTEHGLFCKACSEYCRTDGFVGELHDIASTFGDITPNQSVFDRRFRFIRELEDPELSDWNGYRLWVRDTMGEGFKAMNERKRVYLRAYTEEGFWEHFEECQRAQRLAGVLKEKATKEGEKMRLVGPGLCPMVAMTEKVLGVEFCLHSRRMRLEHILL